MLNGLLAVNSYPEYTRNATIIIVCMFISIVAAACVSLYHKHVLGSFIRFLRSSGACDESTAIPLNKTKYAKNVFVRTAIKNGRTYACVLRSVAPEGAPEPEKLPRGERKRAEKTLLSESGYYIPEELSFRADNVFSKRGTTVGTAIFGIVLFVLVAAAAIFVVPSLIDLFRNWTGIG